MSPTFRRRQHIRQFSGSSSGQRSGSDFGGFDGSRTRFGGNSGNGGNNNNNDDDDEDGEDDNDNSRDRSGSNSDSGSNRQSSNRQSSNNNNDDNDRNNGLTRRSTVVQAIPTTIVKHTTVLVTPNASPSDPIASFPTTIPQESDSFTGITAPTASSSIPTSSDTVTPTSSPGLAPTTSLSAISSPSPTPSEPLDNAQSLQNTKGKSIPATSILAILMGLLFLIVLALVIYVSRDRFPCQCIRRPKRRGQSKYSASKSGRSQGSATTWRDYLTTTFYTRSHCTRSIFGPSTSSGDSFASLSRFQFPAPSSASVSEAHAAPNNNARTSRSTSELRSPDMEQIYSAQQPISVGLARPAVLDDSGGVVYGRESRRGSASSLSQYPFEVQHYNASEGSHLGHGPGRKQP